MKDTTARSTLTIARDHPAFAGHFPGAPMLPGVVLLDETLGALRRAGVLASGAFRIGSAKFFQPVLPGAVLIVRHRRAVSGAIEFDIAAGETRIASGSVIACGANEASPT